MLFRCRRYGQDPRAGHYVGSMNDPICFTVICASATSVVCPFATTPFASAHGMARDSSDQLLLFRGRRGEGVYFPALGERVA